jgi:hypothetical protein
MKMSVTRQVSLKTSKIVQVRMIFLSFCGKARSGSEDQGATMENGPMVFFYVIGKNGNRFNQANHSLKGTL